MSTFSDSVSFLGFRFQTAQTRSLCELLADVTGEPVNQLCSTSNPVRANGASGRTIDAAIDFHSYGQAILGTWAHTNQPGPGTPQMNAIGREMARAMEPEVRRHSGRIIAIISSCTILYFYIHINEKNNST
jgi:hypothetical protein